MKSIRDTCKQYLELFDLNEKDLKEYELLEKYNHNGSQTQRIKELDKKIRDNTILESELLNDIKNHFSILKSPMQKQVMQYRYIERFKWSDVCYILFSSCNDYEIEKDKYMLKLFRYHKRAIDYIDKYYKDES